MIFGSNQTTGNTNLGARLFRPRGLARWWDPDNEGFCIAGAYRSIASIGSPWALAPANYAETLQDWSATSPNLTEGNGAVPWAAATGWGFVAAAAQYFDTSIVPASGYSMLVQYANGVAPSGYLAGVFTLGARTRLFLNPSVIGPEVRYGSGGIRDVAPNLLTGNIAVAGQQGYRNGIAEGALITAWDAPNILSAYIGCYNQSVGGPTSFITADIYAVAIYNCTLTAPQVLSVATAMSQL